MVFLCFGQSFPPTWPVLPDVIVQRLDQWSGSGRGLFERNRFWLACVTRFTAPLIERLFAKSLLVSSRLVGRWHRRCVRGQESSGKPSILTRRGQKKCKKKKKRNKETENETLSLLMSFNQSGIIRPVFILILPLCVTPPLFLPHTFISSDMLFTAWGTWQGRRFGVIGQSHRVSHSVETAPTGRICSQQRRYAQKIDTGSQTR